MDGTNRRSVLLVEDSPDDAALVGRALRKAKIDCDLTVVHDARSGLDLLHHLAPSSLPAFVLVDLKMPGMDGEEFVRAIRADPQLAWLPVVVFTSSDEERDLARCYAAGASSYVRKPMETFAATVSLLASYWLGVNEPPPLDAQAVRAVLPPPSG